MIVLDTNVLSALMRSKPEAAVVDWLNAQPLQSVYTTAVSVFELQFGMAVMPIGKKRQAVHEAFEAVINQDFKGRVLDFDPVAAGRGADIAARLQAAGRRGEIRDLMIAGIVAARQGTLATRNTKDFANTGIPLVDPWQGGQP